MADLTREAMAIAHWMVGASWSSQASQASAPSIPPWEMSTPPEAGAPVAAAPVFEVSDDCWPGADSEALAERGGLGGPRTPQAAMKEALRASAMAENVRTRRRRKNVDW